MMLIVLPLVALGLVAAASVPAPYSAARDRDRDRLPDRWERRYHLSTSKKSAKGDPDRDGLRNLREYRLRTNPRKRDTDGDGYGDRAELRAGRNPRDRASRPGAARKGYQFPNRETTGVPDGWAPRQTRANDLTVTRPGTVVQDIRFTNGADVIVKVRDVTIRRVDMQGGVVTNQSGSTCGTGLLVEDSTFEPAEGQPFGGDDYPVIGEGGYAARRVEIWKRGEGFRASDCGPVTVTEYIVGDTPDCGRDLHSDGVQAITRWA
jgi:hypothetical protein